MIAAQIRAKLLCIFYVDGARMDCTAPRCAKGLLTDWSDARAASEYGESDAVQQYTTFLPVSLCVCGSSTQRAYLTSGPVAQWIRHRPTEPGIAGSSPAGVIFHFTPSRCLLPLEQWWGRRNAGEEPVNRSHIREPARLTPAVEK